MNRQPETKFYLIAKSFELAREVVKASVWLGGFYYAYRSIVELAGKQTDAKIAIAYIFSSGNDYGLPWVLAICGLVYGYIERRLRERKTAYLQGRIRELEEKIDPNRKGSGLLPTGRTNPDDEI